MWEYREHELELLLVRLSFRAREKGYGMMPEKGGKLKLMVEEMDTSFYKLYTIKRS